MDPSAGSDTHAGASVRLMQALCCTLLLPRGVITSHACTGSVLRSCVEQEAGGGGEGNTDIIAAGV